MNFALIQAAAPWYVVLENTHPGKIYFALEEGDGRPSRWNTLRALPVLSWYEEVHQLIQTLFMPGQSLL